jgi:hypothetical protein
LADITFQHIALKKETSDEKSTEDREQAIEQLLIDFEAYQRKCIYDVVPNQIIINLIKSVDYDVKMENEQYSKSYEIEPRAKKNIAPLSTPADSQSHQRSESAGGKWEFGKIQISKSSFQSKKIPKTVSPALENAAIIPESSETDSTTNQNKKRERKYSYPSVNT